MQIAATLHLTEQIAQNFWDQEWYGLFQVNDDKKKGGFFLFFFKGSFGTLENWYFLTNFRV